MLGNFLGGSMVYFLVVGFVYAIPNPETLTSKLAISMARRSTTHQSWSRWRFQVPQNLMIEDKTKQNPNLFPDYSRYLYTFTKWLTPHDNTGNTMVINFVFPYILFILNSSLVHGNVCSIKNCNSQYMFITFT